jgi:hypothetical protein
LDTGNRGAEHGITQDEFEEVVMNPDRETKSRSSGLPAVYGYTSTGKFIFCVYQIINSIQVLPVAAYEVE